MNEFKIGDKVTITGKYKRNPWVSGMNNMCGKKGTISKITFKGNVQVDVADGISGYTYHPDDLEHTSYVPEDLFQI